MIAISPNQSSVRPPQEQFSEMGSKFVSLFLIGFIWMILTYAIIIPLQLTEGAIFDALLLLHGFVNLLCVYLQCTFASKHFEKVCPNFNCCCDRIAKARMQQEIVRISQLGTIGS